MKIDDKVSNALRDETPLPTAKLEALRSFTLEVVRTRGNASKAAISDFLKSDYTHRRISFVTKKLLRRFTTDQTTATTTVDLQSHF